MVIGGKQYAPSLQTLETVNFQNSSKVCNIPEDYPMPTYSGSAEVLSHANKQIPIVCAGSYRENGVRKSRDTCHFLQFENQQWTWTQLDKTMSEKRFMPASIITDDGRTLWVTGGYNDQIETTFKSTDLVSISDNNGALTGASFTIKPGPNLPETVAKHCLVKLNSSTAMMIGGDNELDPVKRKTFFLDIQTGRSLPGPELNMARCWHKCGVLLDPGDGNHQVVLAAGGLNGDYLKSTEMWVVGSNQGWTEGPDLPVHINHAEEVVVNNVNKLLVVGCGEPETMMYLFEHDWNEGWIWSKLDQELSMPRKRSMSMLISKDFCYMFFFR